jgi:hypothetical protein
MRPSPTLAQPHVQRPDWPGEARGPGFAKTGVCAAPALPLAAGLCADEGGPPFVTVICFSIGILRINETGEGG